MLLSEVLQSKQFDLKFTEGKAVRRSSLALARVQALKVFTHAEQKSIEKLEVNAILKIQRANVPNKLMIEITRIL